MMRAFLVQKKMYAMKKILLGFYFVMLAALTFAQQDTVIGFTFPLNAGEDSLNANYGTSTNQGYDIRAEIASTSSVTDITLSNGQVTGDYAATAEGWDNGANDKFWSIKFKTTNFQNMVLYSKQRAGGTNGGPKFFKVQYKIGNSGTWTDITNGNVTLANDWTTGVINALPLPSNINNASSSVYIRWIMTTNEDVNGGDVTAAGVSKIDDIFILGEPWVGIDEQMAFNNTNIYPNPCDDVLNIDAPFEVNSIELFDICGKLVLHKEISGISQINVSNLQAGLYYISIYNTNNNIKINQKVLIK